MRDDGVGTGLAVEAVGKKLQRRKTLRSSYV